MAWTSHGHEIPGSSRNDDHQGFIVACGGPGSCGQCQTEAQAYLSEYNADVPVITGPSGPCMFRGYRPYPPASYVEKGISQGGLKPDYEGAVYSDGTVVIRWLTDFRSHSVWSCWDDFFKVHGHPEYGTVIKFSDLLDLGED